MTLRACSPNTIAFAVAASLAALPQAHAKILAQWVQLGPDGSSKRGRHHRRGLSVGEF